MNKLKFRFTCSQGVILVIFLCITFFAISEAGTPSLEIGAEHAKPIIAALEAYKLSRGYYPLKLDTLVSTHFLSEIPKVNWRYHYIYEYLNMKEGYILSFPLGGDKKYCYSPYKQKWEFHDSEICR